MFRDDPQVHIIGHWTYPLGTKKTIYVTSNCKNVELFVNGKSLGHGENSDRYLFAFQNVEWQPGNIEAVAYKDGNPVATNSLHTVGTPVALKLTPLPGPSGLLANGSDVALIDVEAVDVNGERCPTFQKRIDFEIEGPGIWRGGYNSGKTNSINNLFLDLECGVNRVSVRSTRTPGVITVRAKCDSLKSGSVSIQSIPFETQNGFSTQLPQMPEVSLPDKIPNWSFASENFATEKFSTAQTAQVGKFVESFSYSGPTTIVHVVSNAQNRKNVYVDRDLEFQNLPPQLLGADWVQTAQNDNAYSALDLMEVAVKSGMIIYVAYDNRVPLPVWLTQQFQPTDLSLNVKGQPMKIFERRVENDESLTLGSDAASAGSTSANMYLVFVKGG
jgi:beta-galactosidase